MIATTRFPHDAAQRYARESRFRGAGRTACRSTASTCGTRRRVEIFTRYLEQTLGRLDILVNNACQTVRRPPGFYAHLLDFEARAVRDLPADVQPLLRSHEACVSRALGGAAGPAAPRGRATPPASTRGTAADPESASSPPPPLSQIPYAYDDADPARRPLPGRRARRRPAAGGPARAQHLAADPGRGGDAGDARGAPHQRGGAVHPVQQAQAADDARPHRATSTS